MNDAVDTHVDGEMLCRALVSGIHSVIADQIFLNKINVYPVADGDTGTNLSLSLGAALGVLQKPGERHLGTLLAATADALLDGSRGNSGAIMAQFFQGVSDSAGNLTRFTTATFTRAMRAGCDYAHDALSNPVEGTILSVIAAFAGGLEKQLAESGQRSFSALFTAVLPGLERALQETTQQLDALRKASVVDAGAKGFVDLISGISDFIVHGRITPLPDMSVLQSPEDMAMPAYDADDHNFRYCTECIVTAENIDRRKLRQAMASLGTSLVLAGSRHKAKVHIHVNDVQQVFDAARRFGVVSGEKADDLDSQRHAGEPRGARANRNFAVITDSAADISDADMERLDIHMVPCRIQFGERGYLDKVSISTSEFYAELARGEHHPTTSQPAPGDFRRQFQFLASHYPDVISINLTSGASGTYEAARSAASRTTAHGKVHVIDSLNASMGQGLLVVYAAECAAAGLSAETALAAITRQIPVTYTYGVLKNMSYAVRGGRIKRWVKLLTDSLRMTPVIRTSPAGKIVLSTCLFGRRNVPARFARHVAAKIRAAGPTRVSIGHAVCPEQAELLAQVLRSELTNIERLSTTELGTALGVHGGPGTLVVATQPVLDPASLATTTTRG
ncbi:MAG: DegV family EDD domain-containing protein [Gammaproteobacteria bacterium]|nr:DegV family EDD domain-containing protein [Gammaproteobacteria bacterium]MDH5303162.1 DegV family EDD domain-containing protein [Gammaproteobacteria bacterium]MDH5320830.1 DegV family EDD domain-containing protein [Gammaproteobacteria bacterium]